MRRETLTAISSSSTSLDKAPDLKARATNAQVSDVCKGHILAEAQLMGRFGR